LEIWPGAVSPSGDGHKEHKNIGGAAWVEVFLNCKTKCTEKVFVAFGVFCGYFAANGHVK
jgi:hypothetical protein